MTAQIDPLLIEIETKRARHVVRAVYRDLAKQVRDRFVTDVRVEYASGVIVGRGVQVPL